MKELSIEEKAKAYDETIKRAKKEWSNNLDNAYKNYRERLEIIFHELKESGDEEVRKAMIDFFKHEREEGVTVLHYGVNIERMIAWLEKWGNADLEFFENGENEKREFVGYGFLKCKGDFLSFKEGETYWLEYVGKDNYNVRSDNLLGQTFHITPQQLYTVFRPTTWLEKQGQVNETIIPQHEDKTCKENNDSLTSEDERIRKAIITFFESEDDNTTYALVPKKDILAWLERQGNILSGQQGYVIETGEVINENE